MKTAVIYARYSSNSQSEQSIEGQLRVCQNYAKQNNIVIVDTYIDRALTGTNDNRASFQKMLKDSNKGNWDYVIVYKLDRFARNKYESAIHRKQLKDNGTKLLSAMEQIPETPEGIILESLLEGMAEYYSAELSQKVKRGLNESRLKGQFTGGQINYGYYVKDKKVYINEDEAQIIRYIFESYVSNKLMTEVVDELNNKGILCRGKEFDKKMAYRFLRNERYIGKYINNGTTYTNIYPAIVSNELFEEARCKIENNKFGKHKRDVVYLLKNKLKCGFCGHSVNSDSGTARNGKIIRYYKCSGKKMKKECELKTIKKEILEDIIIEAIINSLKTNELILEISKKVIERNKKLLDDNATLKILNQEQEEIEKSIHNVLLAIEKGIITSSTKEHLEKLEEQKIKITEAILIENSKQKFQLTEDDIFKYLKNAISKKSKQMIDLLIKEIKIYNNKIEIFFKYNKTKDNGIKDYQSIYSDTKLVSVNNNEDEVKMKVNIKI